MLIFRYSTYFKKIEKNSDAAQHTSLSSKTKIYFKSKGAKQFFVCAVSNTQHLIYNLIYDVFSN